MKLFILFSLKCFLGDSFHIRSGKGFPESEGGNNSLRKLSRKEISFPFVVESTPFAISIDTFTQYQSKETIDKLLHTADTQMRELVMPSLEKNDLNVYFTNVVLAQSKVQGSEGTLSIEIKKTAVINRKGHTRDINRNMQELTLPDIADIDDAIESMYLDSIQMDRLIKNLNFLFNDMFGSLMRVRFSHFLEERSYIVEEELDSLIQADTKNVFDISFNSMEKLTWPVFAAIVGLISILVIALSCCKIKGTCFFRKRRLSGSAVERRLRKQRLDDAMNAYTSALKRYRAALNDDSPKSDSEKIQELQRNYNETMTLYQGALQEWKRSGKKIDKSDTFSQGDTYDEAMDVCVEIAESISSKSDDWMSSEDPLENSVQEKTCEDNLNKNRVNPNHNQHSRDMTSYNTQEGSQANKNNLASYGVTNESQINELSFDETNYENYHDDIRTVKTKDSRMR
mmetsp:Transcript_12110/g.18499  ORF Transcript_12110/g.18499 Transcript_12110/m.18499 type:complete len:455 (+) Transcript_12110:2-1366(+)